jgi:hypothetical protein
MQNKSTWLAHALVTGAAGVAATAAVIAVWGQAKQGAPWAPFNAVAHMVFGDQAAARDGFSARETLVGLGLHAGAITTWAALYEASPAGKLTLPQSLGSGALAAALVYLLDYHVLPERLRPGFEKRLGPESIPATYAALALAFGLSPLWKSGDANDNHAQQ